MTSERDFLSKRIERVQNAVRQFPATATNLNDATDKLGVSVSELDTTLKKFAFGVPTWVSFSKSDENLLPFYWAEEIGYAKIGGKWGIAIRTVEGEYKRDENTEQWLFNDSPRLLRVRAVEKIPDLLEALLANAAKMAKEITEKANEVSALAAGINSVVDTTPKPKTGQAVNGRMRDENTKCHS